MLLCCVWKNTTHQRALPSTPSSSVSQPWALGSSTTSPFKSNWVPRAHVALLLCGLGHTLNPKCQTSATEPPQKLARRNHNFAGSAEGAAATITSLGSKPKRALALELNSPVHLSRIMRWKTGTTQKILSRIT